MMSCSPAFLGDGPHRRHRFRTTAAKVCCSRLRKLNDESGALSLSEKERAKAKDAPIGFECADLPALLRVPKHGAVAISQEFVGLYKEHPIKVGALAGQPARQAEIRRRLGRASVRRLDFL